MRSAIYEGVVTHRRHATSATGHVAHRFEHRLALPLLFLDEIEQFCSMHPLWSSRRLNVVWFRRADYLGDRTESLDASVRNVAYASLGRRPKGRVALLGNLRTWGWLFNPVTIYYCFEEDSSEIDVLLLEVTSTPWHERHVYVIDGRNLQHRFAKRMHVSPFLGMDQEYVMHWSVPDERLSVHLGNRQGEERILDASIAMQRRGSTRADLARLVWRIPQTYAVSLNIYRQALRLIRKGAPFHPRSRPSGGSMSCPVAPEVAVRG
jgi:DUF1365 family protein